MAKIVDKVQITFMVFYTIYIGAMTVSILGHYEFTDMIAYLLCSNILQVVISMFSYFWFIFDIVAITKIGAEIKKYICYLIGYVLLATINIVILCIAALY